MLVVALITRGVAIAADLVVLVLTWMKTYDVWKEHRKTTSFTPSLTILLVRNGMFMITRFHIDDSH